MLGLPEESYGVCILDQSVLGDGVHVSVFGGPRHVGKWFLKLPVSLGACWEVWFSLSWRILGGVVSMSYGALGNAVRFEACRN